MPHSTLLPFLLLSLVAALPAQQDGTAAVEENEALRSLAADLRDPAERAAAVHALVQRGPAAIDPALEVLRSAPDRIDPGTAGAALDVLRRLGPRATPALPVLRALRPVAAPSWRADVDDALLWIWPFDPSFWNEPLDFDRQYTAAYRRTRNTPAHRTEILTSLNRLRRVRRESIDPRTVDRLVPYTVDADRVIQRFACRSLVRHGDSARVAVSALAESVRYPFPMVPAPVRDQPFRPIVDTLLAIAPEDPATVRAHGYLMLYGETPEVRIRGLRGVASFGERAASMCRYLLRVTDDRNPRVVLEAVRTLGRLGPAAGDAAATLLKLRDHTDPRIARAAEQALLRVRGNG